ncbi:MAG: M28 family metallopeptidase [Oscillospiraceae bacterium]|nr:M28 family metallopeptidase [Oscillospiraceae bacterium]
MHDLYTLAETFFNQFPTRFRRKAKQAFLVHCGEEFRKFGYGNADIVIQKNKGLGGENFIVWPPERTDAEIFITAHYDTPPRSGFFVLAAPLVGQAWSMAIMPIIGLISGFPLALLLNLFFSQVLGLSGLLSFLLLNVVLAIPTIVCLNLANKHNHNDNGSGLLGVFHIAAQVARDPKLKSKVAFVLFDNEEWGLFGARAFAKCRYKQNCSANAPVINLDCIGNGDTVLLTAKTKHNIWQALGIHLQDQGFNVTQKKSFLTFPSDHLCFPRGVMLAFARKSKFGSLYLPRIHSGRDTVCDIDTVARLGDAVVEYMGTLP